MTGAEVRGARGWHGSVAAVSVILGAAVGFMVNTWTSTPGWSPVAIATVVAVLALAALEWWRAVAAHPGRSADPGDVASRPAGDLARPTALFQLPADTRYFTDRQAELDEAEIAFREQGGLYVVTGMGGVGKTAFAVHLAHRLATAYPDAQLYVDLQGYSAGSELAPHDILPALLGALGYPTEVLPKGAAEQAALYRSVLATRHALVLLDNASSEDQVRPLLPGSATCLVLVTSRSRLLGLVAVNAATLLELRPFATDDGVALLARIGGSARVMSQRDAAGRVADLCGGLPLALGVVAARLASRRSLTLADIQAQLGEEGDRLQELRVGDVEVRASIELSYRQMGPQEARLFRLLGLFPAQELPVAACPALVDEALDAVRRSLGSLEDANLVYLTSVPARVRMHDLVRIFARERLLDEEDHANRDAALRRLLDWYLAMAAGVSDVIVAGRIRRWQPRPVRWGLALPATHNDAVAWFESERLNLVTACREAQAAGLHDVAWKIADSLWGFFQLRSYWTDWEETYRVGLSSAVAVSDTRAQAWMLTGLGGCQWETGRYDEAVVSLTSSLELHTANGEQSGQSRALMNLSFAYGHMGRYQDSIDSGEQALAISRRQGDRYRTAWTLYSLATSHTALGTLDVALACCQEALALFVDLGNRAGQSYCHDSMGRIHRDLGTHEASISELEQAFAAAHETGNPYGEGMTLASLAETYLAMGQRDRAIELWRRSHDVLAGIKAPQAQDVQGRLREISGRQ